MVTTRFTCAYEGRHARVRDNGELLPARFHTIGQAIDWINHKLDKIAKANPPQTGMRGRARAHLLPDNIAEHMLGPAYKWGQHL